jgi:hypothetical protein
MVPVAPDLLYLHCDAEVVEVHSIIMAAKTSCRILPFPRLYSCE